MVGEFACLDYGKKQKGSRPASRKAGKLSRVCEPAGQRPRRSIGWSVGRLAVWMVQWQMRTRDHVDVRSRPCW